MARLSENAGVSYLAGAADYRYELLQGAGAAASASNADAAQFFIASTGQAVPQNITLDITIGKAGPGDRPSTCMSRCSYAGFDRIDLFHSWRKVGTALGNPSHLRLIGNGVNVAAGTEIRLEWRA
jgi:hypothetical protein